MTTATLTAEKAIGKLTAQAEAIKCDALQRFPEAASPGDGVRQGDVYVELLAKRPTGCKKIPFRAQVAEGTTQGSRHCLDSAEGVTMYALKEPGPLDGPVLVLKRERTLTHPEHGDWVLPPGTYQISFQRDLDAEDRERRVMD